MQQNPSTEALDANNHLQTNKAREILHHSCRDQACCLQECNIMYLTLFSKKNNTLEQLPQQYVQSAKTVALTLPNRRLRKEITVFTAIRYEQQYAT
jgi:hypothetical protein